MGVQQVSASVLLSRIRAGSRAGWCHGRVSSKCPASVLWSRIAEGRRAGQCHGRPAEAERILEPRMTGLLQSIFHSGVPKVFVYNEIFNPSSP